MRRGHIESWTGEAGFIRDAADKAAVFVGARGLVGWPGGRPWVGAAVAFRRHFNPKRGLPEAEEARPLDPPVPRDAAAAWRATPHPERHPGLGRDKFFPPGDPAAVAQLPGDPGLLAELSARRREWLAALGAVAWSRTTDAPLVAAGPRASALDDAPSLLDQLYGFARLPGPGLKGLARAFAESVWKPAQPDADAAARDISAVFGEPGTPGAVAFHDAWPEAWPRLALDVASCHHPSYYRDAAPPGDWSVPERSAFLVVEPRTAFRFAVAPLAPDAGRLLELARAWLDGGLTHLGFGPRKAAGYGTFAPADGRRQMADGGESQAPESPLPSAICLLPSSSRLTLRLLSPAFLGGPGGDATRLRGSALKGLLRAWWRAARGHLPVEQLREADAAFARGLAVRPLGPDRPRLWRKGQHVGPAGGPLGYLGFGPVAAQRADQSSRTQADALDAGQDFDVALAHPSPDALREALGAAWLLAAVGGLGARARRGFGAVQLATDLGGHGLPHLAACRTPDDYRAALARGLEALAAGGTRPDADAANWTALTKQTRFVVSRRTFRSWQEALDDLGRKLMAYRDRDRRGGGMAAPPGPDYHALKDFAAGRGAAYLPGRAAFGLPFAARFRSLDGRGASFAAADAGGAELRRASPVYFTLARLATGALVWQAAWLPGRFLPDGAGVRAERFDPRHGPTPAGAASPPAAVSPAVAGFFDWLRRGELGERSLGSPVLVTLVKPHEAGGRKGFFVREPDDADGPLGLLIDGTPPDPVPEAGATVTAVLYNLDPRSPRYRWDPIPPPPERPRRPRDGDGPRR